MAESTQTEFEKPRGVNRVEVRDGYAQVHVSQLGAPLAESRLQALRAVASASVSIDFLKLTQGGLSFMVPEGSTGAVEPSLKELRCRFTVAPGRSIVLVHAANLRDEEGLLAKLVSIAIAAGVNIEHLSDMHDRMLLVTDDSGAKRLAKEYESQLLRRAE
jgi:aspartokinase